MLLNNTIRLMFDDHLSPPEPCATGRLTAQRATNHPASGENVYSSISYHRLQNTCGPHQTLRKSTMSLPRTHLTRLISLKTLQ